jgi:hypothetical protein
VKLWTINRILRRFGLVLVFAIPKKPGEEDTIIYLTTVRRYEENCKKNQRTKHGAETKGECENG